MVKIEDGSIVYASQLRGGGFEDGNGNKVNFQKLEGSNPEVYQAEVPLNDGSGRVEVWTASLGDTQVRVSKLQQTQQQVQDNKRASQERIRIEREQAQQAEENAVPGSKAFEQRQQAQQQKEQQQRQREQQKQETAATTAAAAADEEESTSTTKRGRSK